MINRTLIRLKIVQLIYSFYQNGGKDIKTAEKELMFSLSKAYDLYNYLLLLLVELTKYESEQIEQQEELNKIAHKEEAVSHRFVNNRFVKQLADNKQLLEYVDSQKRTWLNDADYLKKLLADIKASDTYADYMVNASTESFMDALNRLVRPDMLLLSFLGKYYPKEMPLVSSAYNWFNLSLEIYTPKTVASFVPHLLDKNPDFEKLVNETIPQMKTGISKLIVKKEIGGEDEIKGNTDLQQIVKRAKGQPGLPIAKIDIQNSDNANYVFEDGALYVKTLVGIHTRLDGTEVEMILNSESDGTRRLIEYMPLFYAVTKQGGVYIVDEIERSMHPILIKDIIQKLSESDTAKGQLIFTTHESGLLDQNIFRPDEIWFAQKDSEQATQLYPLSDYNIHKTANIENGYLNGRYGGIPFLSNLKDLHW